ncbi:hypothetical protein BC936DRAFT_141209 [Jimgerdemannia flammicorona]|uniref:Uncharacterized protein n=1 Tax=Jimgerdemannia flammicorona TaxID=994334 RepID=A0A433DGB9_9FUNG|nr:hypothetical protein BC936DRAFT_141209 [Jimgerdemannia flammicorona]
MNVNSPLSLAEFFDDDDELFFLQNTQILIMSTISILVIEHDSSVIGYQYIDRNHLTDHEQLYNNYFANNPTYLEKYF